MGFELRSAFLQRIYYEPNKRIGVELPSNGLYYALDMLLKLQVDIASGGASNAPAFQVFNAIDTIELVRNSKTSVWSMTGQVAALMFTNQRLTGVASGLNSTISGTAGTDKEAQHFLHIPAAPLDAANPKDFAIDTRFNDYELFIKWKNLTEVGTLFGTHTGAVTALNSENYIDIELKPLVLLQNPRTGQPDQLETVSPLVVGYREEREDIGASNSNYKININENEDNRNIILYTTHNENSNQEVGVNTVLDKYITLKDTKQNTIQHRQADMVREATSIRWGMGSSLHDGVYDINLTAFGNVTDTIKSSQTRDLRLQIDVTKLANETYVRPIFVTQEKQTG